MGLFSGGTGDAVQELDDAVGQLMAAVLGAAVDENTITFFTSDNGNPECASGLSEPDGGALSSE